VQRVELVGVRIRRADLLLEPAPLHDRRFEERGRRIRVVLEQLGGTAAVVREIEAAEERQVLRPPRAGHTLAPGVGNGELREAVMGDDVLDGIETARMQLAGRRFQGVDLVGRELVAARLVPIRAVDRVVREADLLAIGLPVRSRSDVGCGS
jgi:hypothetical protein